MTKPVPGGESSLSLLWIILIILLILILVGGARWY
jgi:flagellar basal body-associated protein FliL